MLAAPVDSDGPDDQGKGAATMGQEACPNPNSARHERECCISDLVTVDSAFRFRWLASRLPPPDKRRLVILTGGRQTGKTVATRDLRGLRDVADALGKEWAGGMVLTRGRRIERLDEARRLWAVPLHRLL